MLSTICSIDSFNISRGILLREFSFIQLECLFPNRMRMFVSKCANPNDKNEEDRMYRHSHSYVFPCCIIHVLWIRDTFAGSWEFAVALSRTLYRNSAVRRETISPTTSLTIVMIIRRDTQSVLLRQFQMQFRCSEETVRAASQRFWRITKRVNSAYFWILDVMKSHFFIP